MSQKSFINCYQNTGNTIKHLYIQDGIAKEEIVPFKPFLGIKAISSDQTTWTDMFGDKIKIKVFESIANMNSWRKENKDILDFYGDVSPVIQFLATQYRKEVPLQREGLKIMNLDIEVWSETGFPKPEEAKHPINAICCQDMVTNKYITFSDKEYTGDEKDLEYIKCKDEQDLLIRFIEWYKEYNPHILTGWNIAGFDIPYLVNRINRILGPEEAKKLSRDRNVRKREAVDNSGQKQIFYNLQGQIIWDYIELYKKYIGQPREGYSLNAIAKVELGEEKVNYDEFDGLSELYTEDFNKFISYNRKDVELVSLLDQKLGFIDLAIAIMHKAKCQPETIFGTVGPWDAILYNELLNKKKLCPPQKHKAKDEFPGGFVVDPIPGLYDWSMVYDIVSSYPNQIISYNLSPETVLSDNILPDELKNVRSFLKGDDYEKGIEACLNNENLKKVSSVLKKFNVAYTCNGQFWRLDKQGFLSEVYKKMFDERIEFKNQLKQAKKEGRNEDAKRLDLIQYCWKILLNSGYGALANQHSRYFDIRIASAITCSGQLAARGLGKYITDNIKTVQLYYGDTDSLFLDFSAIIKERFKNVQQDDLTIVNFLLKLSEKAVEPVIADYLKLIADYLNMHFLTINMEAECIANANIQVAKKRYIMNKVWDEGTFCVDNPKLKVRGVEIVRTSTPAWVRNKLKETVSLIFKTKSNDKIIEFIEKTKKEFMELPIEQIAFPRGVNFNDWHLGDKGIPQHTKSAYLFNELIKQMNILDKYQPINDGDKIKFLYIKVPNIIHSNSIAFLTRYPEEFKKVFTIDYETQFEKTFLAPLQNILNPMNWSTETINNLEDFFS